MRLAALLSLVSLLAACDPDVCTPALVERLVRPDDGERLVQIYPAAAFDGSGVWLAYVRPDAGGEFDVFATRVDCRASVEVAPFSVQTDPAFANDVDPEIAISGDRMLIAWVADDGVSEANLSVRYRVLTLAGEPVTEADRRLETTHEGAAVTSNHLGVRIAVAPNGDFVLAGARGVPGVMGFSAYAQRVDRDGAPVGATLEPAIDPEVSQTGVAVAVTDDGTVWLAWDSAPATGEAQVLVRSFARDAAEPALEGLGESGSVDLLADGPRVWAAFTATEDGEADLRLVDVSAPLAERRPAVIGASGRLEHSPRLARGPGDRHAIVYFRQIRGFTNEVQAAAWTPGAPPTVADSRRLDESGAPTYGPPLVHLGGDFWLTSYAEGTSREYRLIARFAELSPPE